MRQTRPSTLGRLFIAALLPMACTGGSAGDARRGEGEGRAPIIGPDAHVDDTHSAVVAIITPGGSQCSGTMVQRTADGAGLYVLTAGHCCKDSDPPRRILVGGDYANPQVGLPVESIHRHPCYHAQSVSSDGYDFCVLRVKDDGKLNVHPIPLAAAPDQLDADSQVTFVGFGSTPAVNVVRRRVQARLAAVTPLMLVADQTEDGGGICHGDSGGPMLITQGGVEVVAGVTSSLVRPASLCDVLSLSGRVAFPGVRAAFLDKVLAGEEPVVKSLLIVREGIFPGPTRDTFIASDDPDRSFGDRADLLVGTPPGTAAIRRALVRFDLSGVPAGAQIVTARAGLHEESTTSEGTIQAHRVTKDWDEERETWASFGDGGFDPTPASGVSNPTAVLAGSSEVGFDLTSLVQDWLDGKVDNHGILLRDPSGAETRFMSSKIWSVSNRPWLNLCYLPGHP